MDDLSPEIRNIILLYCSRKQFVYFKGNQKLYKQRTEMDFNTSVYTKYDYETWKQYYMRLMAIRNSAINQLILFGYIDEEM